MPPQIPEDADVSQLAKKEAAQHAAQLEEGGETDIPPIPDEEQQA